MDRLVGDAVGFMLFGGLVFWMVSSSITHCKRQAKCEEAGNVYISGGCVRKDAVMEIAE